MNQEKPLAIFTFGKPLSGKTTLSMKILDKYPDFIYLNSDDIRKRLFDKPSAYDVEQNKAAFTELKRKMKESLKSGTSIIYDVTNSVKEERAADVGFAEKLGARVVYLNFDISNEILEERRKQRNKKDGAITVTKEQLENWIYDSLSEDEAEIIKIDGDNLVKSEKDLFDFLKNNYKVYG